ncbi:MAG: 16S rRNA (guanine(966)-N(2))-methyltransferase RsmD [Phycisphaerae bacterium]
MRVIAGRFRGRRLAAPAGDQTRPITDRVKESLFSVLGHRFGTLAELPAFEVLDLFAGSGALGIESLSRGAAGCTFVERDKRSLVALRANVALLRDAAARIVVANAWTLRFVEDAGPACGLIFADPPYRDGADPLRIADLLDSVATRLAADGLLVYRHSTRYEPPRNELRRLEVVDERRFGTMGVVILGKRDAGAPVG